MENQKHNRDSENNLHKEYMQRCIDLAMLGHSYASPNPMVGAVIVHNNKIIGEGWHRKHGEAHAEVNAINSVKNKTLLAESSVYVSLEPCAHFGKTPPCATLIIKHKIPRVIIGCIDSFSKVSGKGIQILKEAGIEVVSGVLESRCRDLNKRFFWFHEKQRPYIILKWAQSSDGFIDKNRNITTTDEAKPNWITSKTTKRLVHKWRSEEDAILIGRKTAQNDNPSLTTRIWPGNNAIRLLIDKNGQISDDYHIKDDATKTIIISALEGHTKANTSYMQMDFAPLNLDQVLKNLYQKNVLSIIVEGGNTTLNAFIKENLWNEARVLIGQKKFTTGLQAPTIDKAFTEEKLNQDFIRLYKNQL